MFRIATTFLLLTAVGCSKAKFETGTLESKIERRLPPGHTQFSLDPERFSKEMGFDVSFNVTYSRPGFTNNAVYFRVGKKGDAVDVRCSVDVAQFEYVGGRLKSEKAIGVTEANWPWVQERAARLAEIAYEVD